MQSEMTFSSILLTIALLISTIDASEDDIDMNEARNEVKTILTDLMGIAINGTVTNHQSLMKTSSFIINDFMFEQFQKELMKLPGRACFAMQNIIQSYYTAFEELLVNCCGFDPEYPEQIETNTPMNAHLKTIIGQCGRRTLGSRFKRSSRTLQQLLKSDEVPTYIVDDNYFTTEEAEQLVVSLLSAIVQIVLDSRCKKLQDLINTAYYFVSHHTNLFSFLQQLAEPKGDIIIDKIDGYINRFFDVLETAEIEDKFVRDRIPIKDDLMDLRHYCLQYHTDPAIERQFDMGGHVDVESTSSGPILKRIYSIIKPIRKYKTFK